jgi:PPOX class probable F420-dependent enzyme
MSGPLTSVLEEFLDAHRIGVLATSTPQGRPRQSAVYYAREGDRLLVSTLAGRLKAKDVERTGWASLSVVGGEPPYPSATFSGPAAIRTEGIGPATALVMQRITGADQPPEPQTDAALAEAERVLLEITVERVSAITHLPSTTGSQA